MIEMELDNEQLENRAAKLVSLYYEILSKPKLNVGDVVMMNTSISSQNGYMLSFAPGIVSRIYDKPIYSKHNENPDSLTFNEPLDIAVFTTYNKSFIEVHANSMRLNLLEDTKPYEKPIQTCVICNGCGKEDFTGMRYNCKFCRDYDLCEECYNHPETLPPSTHNPATHKMQEIPPMTLSFLKEMYEKFTTNTPFKPGDIVRWKEGFKNRTLPGKGDVAVVVDVFPAVYEPLDSETPVDSQYFREPYDCKLGVIGGGKFMIFHYDSRRFEVVEKK